MFGTNRGWGNSDRISFLGECLKGASEDKAEKFQSTICHYDWLYQNVKRAINGLWFANPKHIMRLHVVSGYVKHRWEQKKYLKN